LRASSGRFACSTRSRSSFSSSCCSPPSPSSSWIAFSCWNLRLDLRAELEHLELAVQDLRQLAQPGLDVGLLEQRLLLVGLQPQGRGDQIGECARVVQLHDRRLELGGQIGDELDDPGEERLHVSRERFDLLRLLENVLDLDELANQVGVVLDAALEADAVQALDDHSHRPVGHSDQALHDRGGSRLVQVVPAGLLDLGILGGE
jgi:hypothetical protein